jgi:hypothetical protein
VSALDKKVVTLTVREMLAAIAGGDFSHDEVRLYLMHAAQVILQNAEDGKPLNADAALKLVGKRARPRSEAVQDRDWAVAWQMAEARLDGENLDAVRLELAEEHGFLGSIEQKIERVRQIDRVHHDLRPAVKRLRQTK